MASVVQKIKESQGIKGDLIVSCDGVVDIVERQHENKVLGNKDLWREIKEFFMDKDYWRKVISSKKWQIYKLPVKHELEFVCHLLWSNNSVLYKQKMRSLNEISYNDYTDKFRNFDGHELTQYLYFIEGRDFNNFGALLKYTLNADDYLTIFKQSKVPNHLQYIFQRSSLPYRYHLFRKKRMNYLHNVGYFRYGNDFTVRTTPIAKEECPKIVIAQHCDIYVAGLVDFDTSCPQVAKVTYSDDTGFTLHSTPYGNGGKPFPLTRFDEMFPSVYVTWHSEKTRMGDGFRILQHANVTRNR